MSLLPLSSPPPAPVRRPLSLIVMHWATVLLLALAVTSVLLRELAEDTAWRQRLLLVHQQTGLLVLALMVSRALTRAALPLMARAAAARPVALGRLYALAAALVHLAIYAVACGLPLLGWAASNARGMALSLLGLVPLPRLVAERDLDLADTLVERHQGAAWLLLALVCLHVAAALWHHFFLRDGLLSTMWPGRGKPGAPGPTS